MTECKECRNKRSLSYYKKNKPDPQRTRRASRKYLGANPDSTKHPETENCEACGKPGSQNKLQGRFGLVWDHDHKTGNHRGWLCTKCNTEEGI